MSAVQRRFEGQVVLVTGAGHGIGRAAARRFAREGATVVVAELDADAGRAVADSLTGLGGDGLFLATDPAQRGQLQAAVQQTVDTYGRLDVLVNAVTPAPSDVVLEDKADAMLEGALQAALWSTWWASQACFPFMKAAGHGRIINLTSLDAEAGAWLRADETIARAAVLGFTRSAGAEWARYGIFVNAVAPGASGPPVGSLSDQADSPASRNPTGRLGDLEEDVAPVIVFLASEDSRYMTGELVHVDGGQHLPRYQSRPVEVGHRVATALP